MGSGRDTGADTISEAEAVWVSAPLVAVMVSGKVPPGVLAVVVTVMVVEPAPVTGVGLKAAVVLAGRPLTANEMLPAKPFSAVVEMEYWAFAPGTTVWGGVALA